MILFCTCRPPYCFYKAAVKRGESRYGRSWGLFRRSKILHRSVYSALWLGGLRCQCRRQTNGPLTARCLCVMVLGKNKQTKKTFCRPLQCVGPPGKCPVCPITSPALIATIDINVCSRTINFYPSISMNDCKTEIILCSWKDCLWSFFLPKHVNCLLSGSAAARMQIWMFRYDFFKVLIDTGESLSFRN